MIDFEAKKAEFLSYVHKSHLPKTIKHLFLDKVFFEGHDFPDVYLYYPELFFDAFFEGDNNQDPNLLNIAGYFYFRYILINDKIIDDGEINKKNVIIASICQEESIKILSNYFPLNSEFWKYWNTRKEEYLTAISIDKGIEEDIDIDQFELLADFRSSFGKIAIDLLFVLTGSKKNLLHESLLKSHRLFSTGFQILDDIQDFEKDIRIHQKNICHSSLRKVLKEKGVDPSNIDAKTFHKYFFVQGVAEELLNKACEYFEEAQRSIKEYKTELKHWTEFVEMKYLEAKLFLLQIKGYEKTLLAKTFLSSSLKENVALKGEIRETILMAYDYIVSMQNENGSWEEICLNAGLSNVWATGYILFNLRKIKDRDGITQKMACDFLSKNRQNGLWGYNTEWIQDTDSSTCVLLALQRNGIDINEDAAKWIKWQRADGGFSTYNHEKELHRFLLDHKNNLSGWTQSHVCVSALAYYFLSSFWRNSLEFKKLEEYLLQRVSKFKTWNSYWWTSDIYASVYTLLGLMKSKSGAYFNITKSIKAIVDARNEDGSYNDKFTGKSSFYTSLVLTLLTSDVEIYKAFKTETDKACNWLVDNQFSDGSFGASTCLRIPSPQVINPEEILDWKIGHKRTNIVTSDFCRLFSTSQTYNALYQYMNVTETSKILV